MNETTEAKPVLQLSRVIAASPERVFAAWTTPEDIKVWFGPATCRVLDAHVNLRVGGEFCFHLLTERFGEIKLNGQYRVITPPSKLVYTWQWEGTPELGDESSLVSVDFIPSGDSTEIRLRHEQLPSVQARDSHAEGWNGTLDKLQNYLTD
jgi:uncharacterized protein YndB with AHSA1/START domain